MPCSKHQAIGQSSAFIYSANQQDLRLTKPNEVILLDGENERIAVCLDSPRHLPIGIPIYRDDIVANIKTNINKSLMGRSWLHDFGGLYRTRAAADFS